MSKNVASTEGVHEGFGYWCCLLGFFPVLLLGWFIGLAWGALKRGIKLGFEYVERI